MDVRAHGFHSHIIHRIRNVVVSGIAVPEHRADTLTIVVPFALTQ